MDYETIKRNYERKLWNILLVKMSVKKGIITPEEYEDITGFVYPNTKK